MRGTTKTPKSYRSRTTKERRNYEVGCSYHSRADLAVMRIRCNGAPIDVGDRPIRGTTKTPKSYRSRTKKERRNYGDWNCNYLHSGRSTCHRGPGALENGINAPRPPLMSAVSNLPESGLPAQNRRSQRIATAFSPDLHMTFRGTRSQNETWNLSTINRRRPHPRHSHL